MPLEEFISRKRARTASIPPGIRARWEERVLPNGWDQMGERGAQEYLKRYGKGIGAQKCVDLAMYAEREQARNIARGFWKRAYELDGNRLSAEDLMGDQETPQTRLQVPPVVRQKPVPPKQMETPSYTSVKRGPRTGF